MTENEFKQQAEQGKRLVSEFSLNNMPKEIMQMALFAGWSALENDSLDYQAKMNSVLLSVEAAYHYGRIQELAEHLDVGHGKGENSRVTE